jgi:sugar lactone lactonase YvrE
MLASLVLALVTLAGLAPVASAQSQFPATIPLPPGWLPEGVVTGRGPVIYAGSRANGAIYAADLRTGEGRILVAGQTGRVAVGLDFDRRGNTIFVAGGATGMAYAYDAASGAELGAYTLATGSGPTFINDAIVTREAVYFTDSQRPVLYRLPLGPAGRLPAPSEVTLLPLSGDYQQAPGFNANGIEATPDGKRLIIVQSNIGALYQVDPATGVATRIPADTPLTNGDGLVLSGQTLYVVRNRDNEIVALDLAPDLSSATRVATLTNPAFDVPTTAARFGDALYAVNGRFTTPPTSTTTYDIVRVPLQ